MHSRILVLDEGRIDLDSVFEEMETYGNGVDYVTHSETKYEYDFAWFISFASEMGFESNKNQHGFKVDSDKFWQKMDEDVRDLLNDGTIKNRYRIEDRVGMKHSFWIYYMGELWTLPHFVELACKDKPEFKVNSFLDYHC